MNKLDRIYQLDLSCVDCGWSQKHSLDKFTESCPNCGRKYINDEIKLDKIYRLTSYLNPKTEEEQDIVKEIIEICES